MFASIDMRLKNNSFFFNFSVGSQRKNLIPLLSVKMGRSQPGELGWPTPIGAEYLPGPSPDFTWLATHRQTKQQR